MHDKIDEIFRNRITIRNNVETIIKYGKSVQKNNNSGQFDLFAGMIERVRPELVSVDGDLSKVAFSIEEAKLIGIPITYDYMDEFYIHKVAFSTHNLQEIDDSGLNTRGMVTIAMVSNIERRTSAKGNPYVKIDLADNGYNLRVYVTGKNYHKYSSIFQLNNVYLFCLNKSNNGFINLEMAEDPLKTSPQNRISKIDIIIKDKMLIPEVREYVFNKMFFGENKDKELSFIFDDIDIKASYKVSLSLDNIKDLRNLECEIKLYKK